MQNWLDFRPTNVDATAIVAHALLLNDFDQYAGLPAAQPLIFNIESESSKPDRGLISLPHRQSEFERFLSSPL